MNKIKSFLTCILLLLVLLGLSLNVSSAPVINSIGIDPLLQINNFGPYTINANITNTSEIDYVQLNITHINGEGTSCFDYFVNGSCADYELLYNLTYSDNLWQKTHIRPDSIYPEVMFATSELTWTNTPQQTTIYEKNYHIFNFSNPFTSTENQSLFIEFYTIPNNVVTSSNIEVYVVEGSVPLSYFESDWRNKVNTQSVGSVNSGQDFDHVHTANSKHYVLKLLTNADGTIGTKNISIDDNFYIILYVPTTTMTTGWYLNYHPSTICTNQNNWYTASKQGSNWETPVYSNGCPDVHFHTARRDGFMDGINAEVQVFQTDLQEVVSNQDFFFEDVPDLPPLLSSFTSPVSGTYYGTINITWNPSLDPNGDPVIYNLTLLNKVGGTLNTIINTSTSLTYQSFDTNTVDDGSYDLMIEACDDGGLCTSYKHSDSFETFNIDNTNSLIYFDTFPENNTLYFKGDKFKFNINCVNNQSNITYTDDTTDFNITSDGVIEFNILYTGKAEYTISCKETDFDNVISQTFTLQSNERGAMGGLMISIGILLIILLGFFLYISTQVSPEYWYFKIIFYSLAFIFLPIGTYLFKTLARFNGASDEVVNILGRLFMGTTYVLTTLTFFFILLYLIHLYKSFKKKRYKEY